MENGEYGFHGMIPLEQDDSNLKLDFPRKPKLADGPDPWR